MCDVGIVCVNVRGCVYVITEKNIFFAHGSQIKKKKKSIYIFKIECL